MFRLSYGKRPIVEDSQKINAGVCVRNALLDFKKAGISRNFNLSCETDVKDLLSQIEMGTSFNLTQDKGGEIEYSEPNKVKMTYTKSNLGKGYILWFICNICGNRVKHLYFPPNSQVMACRKCHRLSYDQQNENKRLRSLSSLFK